MAPLPGVSGNDQLAETAAALRWLRGGLSEETMGLELPPEIRSAISPIIVALRWGALLYGMVYAGTQANSGDLGVVATLTVALFLTVWRTFRPLRLAWTSTLDRSLPVVDSAVLGAAVGLNDGFDSYFIYVLMVALAVAAFGWGLRIGAISLAAALVALSAVTLLADGSGLNLDDVGAVALTLVIVGGIMLLASLRDDMITSQSQRVALSNRLDLLGETNEMLGILNQVARTLPESMDMSEAINATERELSTQFNAKTIGLVVRDDATSSWLPMITQGCHFGDATPTSELPTPMQQALLSAATITSDTSDASDTSDQQVDLVGAGSTSGLYAALRTRGKVIGVLAVETDAETFYQDRDVRILDGLSAALALTIDNVRSFGRLRTLGADEERTRIARDLHDRLGQWLTYISLELERIMGDGPDTVSLQGLYGDVQTAIEELRETLRQLRTRVSESETLEVVGAMMLERFTERTGIQASLELTNPGGSLRVNVENELLRIMQESLNNVEKHSQATSVKITWDVDGSEGVLKITDNGKGFDKTSTVGETSYGLLGMRERADVIGAAFNIDSERGGGTTIRVRATNDLGA